MFTGTCNRLSTLLPNSLVKYLIIRYTWKNTPYILLQDGQLTGTKLFSTSIMPSDNRCKEIIVRFSTSSYFRIR